MTAPHGPSKRVVMTLAEANLWPGAWTSMGEPERNLYREQAAKAWPTIYAEVRAAVVAECVAVADDALARFTHLAKPLDSDPDRDPVQQYVDAAMGADFVADRLRSLLPPVSAPGPTLPEVSERDRQVFVAGAKWWHRRTGFTMWQSEQRSAYEAAPANIASHLASRAERGPTTPDTGESV